MITRHNSHWHTEFSILLIIRIDIVVAGDRRQLRTAPDMFQCHLFTDFVGFHHYREHVDAGMRERLTRTIGHAVTGRYDAVLTWGNDVSPVGVHAYGDYARVVSAQLWRVEESQSGTVDGPYVTVHRYCVVGLHDVVSGIEIELLVVAISMLLKC